MVMKKHSGMRPHDIAILLKIASKGKKSWYMKDLAYELKISASEISESINRSVLAGLISSDKKTLNKLALLDFLKSGLKYVYPQQPGAMVRGIGTAHSAPPLNNQIMSEEQYVWPFAKGNIRGQAIEPLHPKTPDACLKDSTYYELMALADAVRVGKAREQHLAFEIIKERIEHA
jgi:predicted transcriptional regulator